MEQERPNFNISELPVVPWPDSVGDKEISAIAIYHRQGRSLAASVALAIIDEANKFREQQRVQNRRWFWDVIAIRGRGEDLERGLASEIVKRSKDWWNFAKPAYVLLNVEELLRSGETFQNPSETWEFVGRKMLVKWEESQKKFGDWLSSEGEDDEGFTEIIDDKMAGETAEWYLQQQSFVDILRNNDPLGFIDRATKLLCDQLISSYYEDKERGALEQGRQRFHQLYTVASQPNS